MDKQTIIQKLREHFPAEVIKQRPDDGYSYIDQEVIMNRLMDATEGEFDVDVVSGPTLTSYPKPKTGEAIAVWVATVKLTIPGVGSRSHVGCARALTDDSAKAAVTDGLKKAATLFGVGLQLYVKPAKGAPQGQARNARTPQSAPDRSQGGGRRLVNGKPVCDHCSTADDRAHAPGCPNNARNRQPVTA
jgi:hypothetical protein